jgi:hypothetical protein
MSKKVIKISLTPEIFGQVDKDGDETLWRSCKGSLLHYEDGRIKKGELYDMKYYRLVSADQSNDEGVMPVTFLIKEDLSEDKIYLKLITPEPDAVEKFFAKQKLQENSSKG